MKRIYYADKDGNVEQIYPQPFWVKWEEIRRETHEMQREWWKGLKDREIERPRKDLEHV